MGLLDRGMRGYAEWADPLRSVAIDVLSAFGFSVVRDLESAVIGHWGRMPVCHRRCVEAIVHVGFRVAN